MSNLTKFSTLSKIISKTIRIKGKNKTRSSRSPNSTGCRASVCSQSPTHELCESISIVQTGKSLQRYTKCVHKCIYKMSNRTGEIWECLTNDNHNLFWHIIPRLNLNTWHPNLWRPSYFVKLQKEAAQGYGSTGQSTGYKAGLAETGPRTHPMQNWCRSVLWAPQGLWHLHTNRSVIVIMMIINN